MKNLIKLFFPLLFAFGLIIGCSKDNEPPIPPQPPADNVTLKVNEFIHDAMTQWYLWYDEMPDLDYTVESDSKEYFHKLLYEEDRNRGWSFITEDIVALENSFAGKEKTFGWSLARGVFSNTGNSFAVVQYVYPATPAADAGVKRGDIIILMNGADITSDNFSDLFYADNVNITFGIDNGESISVGSSVDLVSQELTLNPVVKTNIVEHAEHKIGYIFYAQYIADFNEALDTAIQSMIDKQVTDLVIDLRYNPGGGISAATHMCSSIAPMVTVNNESRLVTMRWNKILQKYWVDNQIMSQIEVNFDKTVPIKFGLDKVHFLIGPGTASASELTITGLSPYMDVTTVGDTTHGKYTASITITPDFIYDTPSSYKSFENWAIQPIVIRYANSAGVTDFKDGFAPNIPVFDNLFDTKPLGDMEDPLFKAAIEDITGSPVIIAMKSAKKKPRPYKILEQRSSRFDKNKQELLFDRFNPELIK